MILRRETSSSFVFHLQISFDLLQNLKKKKFFKWKVFRRYVPGEKLRIWSWSDQGNPIFAEIIFLP